jgi:Hep_Hag.
MDLYHFASDGSLIKKTEAGYCQQYSNNVSVIFAYVDGINPVDYVGTISFTPAGASSSITLNMSPSTQTINGVATVGYILPLPSPVTQIAGAMAFNLYITSILGVVLVTQTGSIYVNASSGVEWDTPINYAQWMELVESLITFSSQFADAMTLSTDQTAAGIKTWEQKQTFLLGADFQNGHIYNGALDFTLPTSSGELATKDDIRSMAVQNSVSISTADLRSLEVAGTMKAGQWYRITDYAPTYSITSPVAFAMAGHQFDIIVQAISGTKFARGCWFDNHAGDAYFATQKLNAWKGEFGGYLSATSASYVIAKLEDEYGNSAYYDFKNAMSKPYARTELGLGSDDYHYTFCDGTLEDASIKGSIKRCAVGHSANYGSYWPAFDFSNIHVTDPSGTLTALNVRFGDSCQDITLFGSNLLNSVFEGNNLEIAIKNYAGFLPTLKVAMGAYGIRAISSAPADDLGFIEIRQGNYFSSPSYFNLSGAGADAVIFKDSSNRVVSSYSPNYGMRSVRFKALPTDAWADAPDGYAIKSEMATALAGKVSNTGNESIAGVKSFTNGIKTNLIEDLAGNDVLSSSGVAGSPDITLGANYAQRITLDGKLRPQWMNIAGTPIRRDIAMLDEVNAVAAIANGKTSSYAISNTDTTGTANAEFVSTAEILTITGLTKTLYTTSGATVLLSALKLGDVVFVTQSGVPDRWVSAKNGTTISFTRIEEKTDLTGYVPTSRTVNGHALTADVTVTKADILGTYGGTLVADLNAIIFSGFYTCLGTATGAPNSSSSWYVTHVNSNAGTADATQTAVSFGTMVVYQRVKTASAWGAWVQETYKTAFDNANQSLSGIVIKGVPYKNVPCGSASGTNAAAVGPLSAASGDSAIASGPYSVASGPYSVASGVFAIASRSFSVAIGNYATSNITRWVSFDGNNSTNTNPQNNYITSFSPDYILFRNANVDYNATAASAYPNLKTLTDYLGAGSPTVVTETMANIVANTSAYFNVTGAGTVGSPFVVKPKTLTDGSARTQAIPNQFGFRASG